MNNKQQMKDLKAAVAEFTAGLDLTAEAQHKLQISIAALPLDPELRGEYLKIIDDDTSIAICAFIMLTIAKQFPAKYVAREIMVEMSRNFRSILGLNFVANASRFKGCPVHGPTCPEQISYATPAAEELRPIVTETIQ